jgi:hypothetical protein
MIHGPPERLAAQVAHVDRLPSAAKRTFARTFAIFGGQRALGVPGWCRFFAGTFATSMVRMPP